MTFQYETTCANCGFEVTLDILVEPEQIGSRYCEDFPEHMEIENSQVCACEHYIDGEEEERILSTIKRSL
jgi:hypothetical protein